MGTSSSYSGPGRNSPLLPPWADNSAPEDILPDRTDMSPDYQDTEPLDGLEQPSGQQHPNGPPLPAMVNFGPARRNFSQYTSGGGADSLKRGVRNYVRGMGGASHAARSAQAGRQATGRLGGFLRDVVTRGIEGALDRLGLGAIVGSPVEVVLATIADTLAPESGSIDEAAARIAVTETLNELYRIYGLEDGDIHKLNAMDEDGVNTVLHISVTNYIYERLLSIMRKSLENQNMTDQQLVRAEREIKEFTRETVKLEFESVDVVSLEWDDKQGKQFVQQIYEQAYAVWEVMQP